MNRDQQPGPQPPGPPQADPPVPWAEFGRQVLAAHHRSGLGAQCVCGSLMYYCPVIAAAQQHGLATDDPRGRASVPHGLPAVGE